MGGEQKDVPATLVSRIERIMDRIEGLVGTTGEGGNGDVFSSAVAFRWSRRHARGRLEPIFHPDQVDLGDLMGLDHDIKTLTRNTLQFIRGLPANNVLVWGERGSGKSSVVKGLLTRFSADGLRMIELQKYDLEDLPAILDLVWGRPERFILFCDDLSFDENESSYRELKALLEGGLASRPDNVLIYATSNRRHLMPTRFSDNTPRFSPDDDEIHPQESIEEKVSLSDRFGLSIGFYRIDQETYFRIVDHWIARHGLQVDPERVRREAVVWLQRSSGRSGRVARQFVDDLIGRVLLEGASLF
ncbi:MAG: ATP-binding protein [candidate division Zixibacteria bacterium]|nr:ATP-binding protein [candidate division Zixibacteria bacterium]